MAGPHVLQPAAIDQRARVQPCPDRAHGAGLARASGSAGRRSRHASEGGEVNATWLMRSPPASHSQLFSRDREALWVWWLTPASALLELKAIGWACLLVILVAGGRPRRLGPHTQPSQAGRPAKHLPSSRILLPSCGRKDGASRGDCAGGGSGRNGFSGGGESGVSGVGCTCAGGSHGCFGEGGARARCSDPNIVPGWHRVGTLDSKQGLNGDGYSWQNTSQDYWTAKGRWHHHKACQLVCSLDGRFPTFLGKVFTAFRCTSGCCFC